MRENMKTMTKEEFKIEREKLMEEYPELRDNVKLSTMARRGKNYMEIKDKIQAVAMKYLKSVIEGKELVSIYNHKRVPVEIVGVNSDMYVLTSTIWSLTVKWPDGKERRSSTMTVYLGDKPLFLLL